MGEKRGESRRDHPNNPAEEHGAILPQDYSALSNSTFSGPEGGGGGDVVSGSGMGATSLSISPENLQALLELSGQVAPAGAGRARGRALKTSDEDESDSLLPSDVNSGPRMSSIAEKRMSWADLLPKLRKKHILDTKQKSSARFKSSNAIEMQRVEEDTNVHSEVFEPMLPSPTRSSEFQGSSPRGRGESLVSSQQEDDLLYHQKKLHGDDSLSPNRTRAISVSAVSLYSMSSIDWSTFEKKSAQIKEQRRNDYETMAKRRSRPPLSNPHSIIPTGQRLFLKRPGSLGQNAAAVNKYKRLSLQPYRTSETPYPKALHCGDELQDRAISAAMLARTNRSSVCSTGTSQKSSNRESPGWDLPSDDNLSSIPSIISIDSVPPKSNKSPPMRSLRSSSMDQNYESRNDAINIHRFPKSHSFYNRAPFANNRASYCSTNGEISEVLENGISRTSFDTNLEPCGTPPINYDTSNISFARINSSNGPSTPACGGVGGFGGRQVKQKPPLPNLKFSAAENIQPSSIITYQNHSPPLPSPGMYEEDSSMFLQHSRATSASSPHLSHKNLQLENNLNQDPIKSRRGKFFQSKPEIPQILNLDRTSHMA